MSMSNRWIPTFLYLRGEARKQARLERELDILTRWKAGENYIDIARDVGWQPNRVRWLIEDHERWKDYEPPPPDPGVLTRQQIRDRNRELIDRHRAGATFKELSDTFGIAPETCRLVWYHHSPEGKAIVAEKKAWERRNNHICCEVWERGVSGPKTTVGGVWLRTSNAIDSAVSESYRKGMSDEEWIAAAVAHFKAWAVNHRECA